MLLSAVSYASSTPPASAGACVACTMLKRGKRVADGLAVGLMMVKKSKKRNPT
ncbi:hypothetical protein [Hymenobacter swuensis]|uniref:Uncharacterized protein n=1 Tax=Hymenobacter swuensis DY53 TaxID=1227739 RepID=W8F5X7_9BACT|nr:hypothetical protein [Hymenobacter swuensis]AHJ97160.1 hypothetical protein Hsw_1565 [Hymenobacter swuensis DY53]